jgi:hypothetical protein
MISRRALPKVAEALTRQAAALRGAKHAGKTTVALALAEKTPSLDPDRASRASL